MTVFLNDNITGAQREALRPQIAAIPGASHVEYESRKQAYARFLLLFKNDRDLVDNVKPEALPDMFHFLLTDRPAAAAALQELGDAPGVYRVSGPEEAHLGHRTGATAPPVPSLPPLTAAHKAAYLSALTRIDPTLAADPDRAVMGGQYTCYEIDAMEPGDVLDSTAMNFMVTIPGGDLDRAKAARILPVVRRYLCPNI
ncbi:MAG: hypothetical protein QOJ50_1739 [Cryptosporangiaceae bacterium]|jgi:hypothetical protein|nr:hypothetical protein [Cryptosporangiaceae bacterium]